MQALFVNNLTVIDFSYFHRERGIVGESLILDVELFGELNDEGMLFDFSFVKKRIKSCVDNLVDHKLLVPQKDPNLEISETPKLLTLLLQTNNGETYQHVSPQQALYFVDAEEITPNSIAKSISSEIAKILPDNVTDIKISLRAEQMEEAFYHYSHGLKKHFGDCQRIAHGHRSKIEVWENDVRSEKWEKQIAQLWKDIYLATEEDIKSETNLAGHDCWLFEYHANQGLFQLTIPKAQCFLLETDTTVELIASFLASYLKNEKPSSTFKVKAYEGVDKGAIMTA